MRSTVAPDRRGAGFDASALAEHVDEVGGAHGGEAVGDEDDGLAPVGEGADLVESALFGAGVDNVELAAHADTPERAEDLFTDAR